MAIEKLGKVNNETTGIPFTMISNELARNTTLSAEARGIALYIASLPSDWSIALEHIYKVNGMGIKKGQRCVNELREAGYFESRRYYDKVKDRTVWEHVFRQIPPKDSEGSNTDRSLTDRSQTAPYIKKDLTKKEITKKDNRKAPKDATTENVITQHEVNDFVFEDSCPIRELGDTFTEQTGLLPNGHNWAERWEPTLKNILLQTKDADHAKEVLANAIQAQRDARTRDGRPYALSSPMSIQSFVMDAINVSGDNSDGPEQWEILCKTIFNWGKRAKEKLAPATYAAYKPLAYAWNTMSQEQLDGKIRQQFLDNLRSERDAAHN